MNPNESPIAYEAFCTYRDLGPSRSLVKTCEKLDRPEGYVRQLETWSSDFSWVQRAKEYDLHLDTKARATNEDKWLKRREQHLESEWEMRGKLLERAKQMLEHPMTREVREDGMLIVEPANWTGATVAQFFKMASDLGRKASGLEDEEPLSLDEGRLLIGQIVSVLREECDESTLERIFRRIRNNVLVADTGRGNPKQPGEEA